jgi:hypothetical protein
MKLACPTCNRQLILKKVGINVIETFTGMQESYQVWSADLWQCPECDRQVIAGFGEQPSISNFDPGFAEYVGQFVNGDYVFMNYEPGGPVHRIGDE